MNPTAVKPWWGRPHLSSPESARSNGQRDCREILNHRDLVDQLREIAKRLHVAANNLEDMAIKRGRFSSDSRDLSRSTGQYNSLT